MGPDYQRPPTETPPTFKEIDPADWAEIDWQQAQALVPLVATDWWQRFDDPVLNNLAARLLSANPTLQQSEAQYRAARAALDAARADLFPTLDLSGGRTRSVTNSSTSSSTSSNSTSPNTAYNATASLSWEIDLWGRVRRNVEAQAASAQASADDLAAVRLSQLALLAQSYVQFRIAQAQARLQRSSATDYARFLRLTQNRLQAGVASPLDLTQAQTQYASANAQALQYDNQVAQYEHALAVLVGEVPARFTVPDAPFPWPVPPAPALLPTILLENRPDIAAAERRVAAANAQIGVAQTAWFPSLTLGGSVGYKSGLLSRLLELPNRIWSFGPTLALNLLDGGARNAASAKARAEHESAVAAYRQTVLTAFQEVEDNLAAHRILAQQAQMQDTAVAAATRAQRIAENQYQAGINSALDVVSAQTTALNAEVNRLEITGKQLIAAIQLLKNAGGRWQPPADDAQLNSKDALPASTH